MNKLKFLFFIVLLFSFQAENLLFAEESSMSKTDVSSAKVKFVLNKNQWEDFINYEASFRGGKLFLEKNAFTFLFEHPDDMASFRPHQGKQIDKIRLHAIKVIPVNALPNPATHGEDEESYFHNYFLGNDASKWASDVPLYKSLVYENLYQGIDMQFYSSFGDVKYDFIVQPDANVSSIQLDYVGVDEMQLLKGDLLLRLSVGDVIVQKPYAFQIIDGVEKVVDCRFVLNNHRLSFYFPDDYNHKEKLIIDPTLVFSSYTGSFSDNWGFSATYDAAGDVYTGGNVISFGYPVTTGAYQVLFAGGGIGGNGWACDMAIAKLSPNGTSILYATYLGGSDNEQPQSLVVDANDELIIFGTTYSNNYPTTVNAFQRTLAGNGDMVISKLSATGNSLLASTYIGGSMDDGLNTDPGFYTTGPAKI